MKAYYCSNLNAGDRNKPTDPNGRHTFPAGQMGSYKVEPMGDIVVISNSVVDELHFCSSECLHEWAMKWSGNGLREL